VWNIKKQYGRDNNNIQNQDMDKLRIKVITGKTRDIVERPSEGRYAKEGREAVDCI
jgi:hypothetical protein